MKNVSSNMQALLLTDSYELATCWQITLQNGNVLGFTDWDIDLFYGGVQFFANGGYTRSAVSQMSDLSIPNLEVQGMLNSDSINDDDIRNGVYDHAGVLIFMMVPTDTNGATYGIIRLRKGWLGQVTLADTAYTAEILGLTQLLSQNFVELFTLDCQADLGDARCKFDLSGSTDTGAVDTVASARRSFTAASLTGSRAPGFYNGGVLTWTSTIGTVGDNVGYTSSEIKSWDGTTFELYLPTNNTINTGDTFTVSVGCNKTLTDCRQKFNNVLNHRGFPYIPGLDKTMFPQAINQNA